MGTVNIRSRVVVYQLHHSSRNKIINVSTAAYPDLEVRCQSIRVDVVGVTGSAARYRLERYLTCTILSPTRHFSRPHSTAILHGLPWAIRRKTASFSVLFTAFDLQRVVFRTVSFFSSKVVECISWQVVSRNNRPSAFLVFVLSTISCSEPRSGERVPYTSFI